MGKEFISPNWHVILIHYPLGVFVLGMVLELVFLLMRYHGSARIAARWMIVIGALTGLPAAYAGMYAMSDVVRRTAPAADVHAPWHEVAAASTLNADQWELIESHVWTSGGTAVIAAVLVTLAVACTDRLRQKLYPVFFILLLGCVGTMSWGAWYAGEMVYREGIAVKLPYRQDERQPTTAPTTAPAGSQADSPAAEIQTERPAGLDYFVNPLQTHVTLAGLAAALGMLGIGLSIRAAATSPHWRDPELQRAGVDALPHPQRGGAEDIALLRSFAPDVEVTGEIERIPVARFWLLAFAVAVLASLSGWWVLADENETFQPQELWSLVWSEGYIRRLAHVIGAGVIVLLPLVLALLARVARRSRATAALFGALLVIAVAAQVWLGALLMFDQPKVPPETKAWYRFQEPTGR